MIGDTSFNFPEAFRDGVIRTDIFALKNQLLFGGVGEGWGRYRSSAELYANRFTRRALQFNVWIFRYFVGAKCLKSPPPPPPGSS